MCLFQVVEISYSISDNFSFESLRLGHAGELESLFRAYYPSVCTVALPSVKDQALAENFWETPEGIDLGAVKSIRYKVMSGNNWNPQ